MSDQPEKKRTPRRRRNVRAFQVAVWTMNGEPMPERLERAIESAVQKLVDESDVRVMLSVKRG